MSRLFVSKMRCITYPNKLHSSIMDTSRNAIRWKVNLNVDPSKLRTKKLPKIELEAGECLPLMNTGKHRLRVYQTLVVNPDGSSYYAESPYPYEITYLPLDLSKMTEEELEKRRIAHLPEKKVDGIADEGFSNEEMDVADDYKHLL
eukprot:TRINITY_DN15812_c0_g1_i1.p1 TRINITY_DN15812_c0_g1~~TRINITY_DN15812_c0_g1_i1.p1  ORF type:complete len:146 (+),score=31.38 TRINITY_DN15812_c0_g1_i1:46-483(+)